MKNALLVMLISTFSSFAQEKFTGYYEPYIKVGYDLTKNFSQEFILEERTVWYEKELVAFKIMQVDVAHFSKLRLSDKTAAAIGFQYRFRENFEKTMENELRFTEEYSFTIKPKAAEFEHRIRAEQRFTPSNTSHRFRYNFAVTRSFNDSYRNNGNAYMIGNVEILLTVANTNKPEYEQRIGGGVGWILSDLLKIEVLTEYRLSNFMRNLVHELYFITGMKISL